MKESPMFAKLKEEGTTSVNPIKESFSHKGNFKMVLLALFGAVMGQGVIWYTGQFYAQNFLETKCNIEFGQSRTIMLWAIAFATPFFLFFGWLSDKIGRKWIMMAGMLGGILLYRPIFSEFLQDSAKVKQWKDNEGSLGQLEDRKVLKSDTVVRFDELKIINHIEKKWRYKETTFVEKTVDTLVPEYGFTLYPPLSAIGDKKFGVDFKNLKFITLNDSKPIYSNVVLAPGKYWKFILLVFVMILFVTMVYGPIAAFLVEMFPTKIRYTSMSLPYHIGNGVFGGLVPFIGLLLTTTFTKDPLVGLWYPISVAGLCFVIGTIYLTNKIDRDIND